MGLGVAKVGVVKNLECGTFYRGMEYIGNNFNIVHIFSVFGRLLLGTGTGPCGYQATTVSLSHTPS